jgi:hypothetical protein
MIHESRRSTADAEASYKRAPSTPIRQAAVGGRPTNWRGSMLNSDRDLGRGVGAGEKPTQNRLPGTTLKQATRSAMSTSSKDDVRAGGRSLPSRASRKNRQAPGKLRFHWAMNLPFDGQFDPLPHSCVGGGGVWGTPPPPPGARKSIAEAGHWKLKADFPNAAESPLKTLHGHRPGATGVCAAHGVFRVRNFNERASIVLGIGVLLLALHAWLCSTGSGARKRVVPRERATSHFNRKEYADALIEYGGKLLTGGLERTRRPVPRWPRRTTRREDGLNAFANTLRAADVMPGCRCQARAGIFW